MDLEGEQQQQQQQQQLLPVDSGVILCGRCSNHRVLSEATGVRHLPSATEHICKVDNPAGHAAHAGMHHQLQLLPRENSFEDPVRRFVSPTLPEAHWRKVCVLSESVYGFCGPLPRLCVLFCLLTSSDGISCCICSMSSPSITPNKHEVCYLTPARCPSLLTSSGTSSEHVCRYVPPPTVYSTSPQLKKIPHNTDTATAGAAHAHGTGASAYASAAAVNASSGSTPLGSATIEKPSGNLHRRGSGSHGSAASGGFPGPSRRGSTPIPFPSGTGSSAGSIIAGTGSGATRTGTGTGSGTAAGVVAGIGSNYSSSGHGSAGRNGSAGNGLHVLHGSPQHEAMAPWTNLDGSTVSTVHAGGDAATGGVGVFDSLNQDHDHEGMSLQHTHRSQHAQDIRLPPGVSIDAITLDSLGRVRNAAAAEAACGVGGAQEGDRDTYDSHAAQHGGGDEQSLGDSSEDLQCRCVFIFSLLQSSL